MKEGWEYRNIGELFSTIKNGANIKQRKGAGGIPITRIETLANGVFNVDRLGYADIEEENKYATYYINDGDILMSHINSMEHVGRSVVYHNEYNGHIIHGMNLLRLVPININSDYCVFYFKTKRFREDILSITHKSVNQASFNTANLKNLQIPVPPLSEQQEIVDYLDTAFAKIDAMKANAEKSLNEAKALFQASLKSLLEPKDGWEEKTLGDICEIIRGKRFVRADIVDDGVPCIHYGDIYTYYGLSTVKTKGCISPELAKKMRFASKNDVVVVQAGENNWDIGVGVAYFGEKPAAVHDACFILKHAQNPMFLSYYFRSDSYHRYLVDYVHEGKICSFLKPALVNAPISLPSLDEQRSIVAILNEVKSKVDQLQENYDKIVKECDTLKQAILRQVFE